MECPQYSIRFEALGYLCANCLLRASTRPKIQGLVSRDSIVDRRFVTSWVREWLANIRFMCRAWRRQQSFGVAENLEGGFLYRVYRPGEWLWIDSNGKMETRLPVKGSFGKKFPLIYNLCGVMAAWLRTASFLSRSPTYMELTTVWH